MQATSISIEAAIAVDDSHMIDRQMLIIEADAVMMASLASNFEREDFNVRMTSSASEALNMIREQAPSVILLDWLVNDRSGVELCRRLRHLEQTVTTPIVLLSSRQGDDDRVRGLEMGANDFVTKPFSSRELTTRVNALVRRMQPPGAKTLVQFADLEVDLLEHRATRSGRRLQLGPKEFRLLVHFMERPRIVFTREQLLTSVWRVNSEVGERTIDVHIRRLRMAINLPGEIDLIRTIRTTGYAMDFE